MLTLVGAGTYKVTLTITVNIPQLKDWEKKLMDALQPIKDAIDRQTSALAAEVSEIADLLRNMQNPTTAEIQAVADRVDAMTDAITHVSDVFNTPPTP